MAATTSPPTTAPRNTPSTADVARRPPRPARRLGYGIAAAANLVGIWIVENLLDWGWPRFLTADFELVVPIITLSFVLGVVANMVYVADDAPWIKSLGTIVTGLVSIVVSVRVWQVFPFDFSTYAIDWTALARAFLVVAIVGTVVGVLIEVARVLRRLLGRDDGGATR